MAISDSLNTLPGEVEFRVSIGLSTKYQEPMAVEARANAQWSMDFMSDTLYHGRRFRTLNILDEGVREALAIVVDTSIPGARVVRTLDRLVQWRGKPNQNAYIERFNRTFRHAVLDAYVFESLHQVREITRQWISEYNEERPHDSLGRIPPTMFRRRIETAENSTLELSH